MHSVYNTIASIPASCPALSCKAPAAYGKSFLNNIITALPATSPTPIGLSPVFLPRGISLEATNDSKDDADSSSSTSTFQLVEEMSLINLMLLFQKHEKLKS